MKIYKQISTCKLGYHGFQKKIFIKYIHNIFCDSVKSDFWIKKNSSDPEIFQKYK